MVDLMDELRAMLDEPSGPDSRPEPTEPEEAPEAPRGPVVRSAAALTGEEGIADVLVSIQELRRDVAVIAKAVSSLARMLAERAPASGRSRVQEPGPEPEESVPAEDDAPLPTLDEAKARRTQRLKERAAEARERPVVEDTEPEADAEVGDDDAGDEEPPMAPVTVTLGGKEVEVAVEQTRLPARGASTAKRGPRPSLDDGELDFNV